MYSNHLQIRIFGIQGMHNKYEFLGFPFRRLNTNSLDISKHLYNLYCPRSIDGLKKTKMGDQTWRAVRREMLKPGDHICTERWKGVFYHYGQLTFSIH